MRVLVACEYSGRVRDAFLDRGHYALSCDLLPSESDRGDHHQGDIFEVLNGDWDLIIAHPPCTYLSVSGLHWNKKDPERALKTEEALDFVRKLMYANSPRICIENPVSCISSAIRKPDQIIQPHNFGEDASKKTCLWLKGLPLLRPTINIPGRRVEVNGKIVERWDNQTDSGQNKLGPSEDRWKIRSRTYQGIADAMAEQWGIF